MCRNHTGSPTAGVDEDLPNVVHDSDGGGRTITEGPRKGLYNAEQRKLIGVGELADVEDAEIEDLWPSELLADVIARTLRGPEEAFSDVHRPGAPIVPQVEAYAAKHGIELETPGWKVGIAEKAKARLLREPGLILPDSKHAKKWVQLFERLLAR